MTDIWPEADTCRMTDIRPLCVLRGAAASAVTSAAMPILHAVDGAPGRLRGQLVPAGRLG